MSASTFGLLLKVDVFICGVAATVWLNRTLELDIDCNDLTRANE
jgi:hypothetical protein